MAQVLFRHETLIMGSGRGADVYKIVGRCCQRQISVLKSRSSTGRDVRDKREAPRVDGE